MTTSKENNIPIPNEIIVEREEEINNEEDDNCIELNTSQEIEEMIEKNIMKNMMKKINLKRLF